MTQATDFVWVLGNHDPAPPEGLGGDAVSEIACGPLCFRHEGVVGAAAGEVCGHHHPKASIPTRGTVVTRPCFVFDGKRLMLPALGAYTGGLNVADPAIAALFPRGGRVFLIGRERLYSFGFGMRRAA
jgi:metallophosphoesterase superfamily enzyme